MAAQRGFDTLQAARAVAASSVMLFHLSAFGGAAFGQTLYTPSAFSSGFLGVDLFFALSGFFMLWTAALKVPPARVADGFLLKRVVRIYPVYWFYCAAALAASLIFPNLLRPDVDIAASLLLYPTGHPAVLLVSWTLVFEMYFYLVFALVLWLTPSLRGRMSALLVWAAMVMAVRLLAAPQEAQVTLRLLSSPLLLEFVLGCMAGWYCARREALPGLLRGQAAAWMLLCGGLLLAAFAASFGEALMHRAWLRVGLMGPAAAAIVAGCVMLDAALRRFLPRIVVFFGDASYTLYLSHVLVIGAMTRLTSRLAPRLDAMLGHGWHILPPVLTALLCYAVAAAGYRLVEKPMLRLLSGLTAPRTRDKLMAVS